MLHLTSLVTFLVMSFQMASVYAMNGDATWYDLSVGLTACGQQYSNSDFVAATAFGYWTTPNPNNDPMCQKSATVTDPQTGRSVTVRIKDKCAGCKPEDIDLSPAAFQALGKGLYVGRFRVNWNFV